jgi:Tripartite tricarboxylate transporter TctB family
MVSRRSLEILTGLITGAFGAAVIVSSIDIGSGWSSGGVEAGTFPMIAGGLVVAGSAYNIGRSFTEANPVLIGSRALRKVAGLLLPTLLFVAAIPLIGIYLSSAAYVVGMLRVQHGYGWGRTLMIAGSTALALYLLFERTFQVLLPRGFLAGMLGF